MGSDYLFISRNSRTRISETEQSNVRPPSQEDQEKRNNLEYGELKYKKLRSCAYNFDNCCVDLKFSNVSMIAIDTLAVENEVADDMYQRSELDYA